jgi:hypothetical protein
MFGAALEQAEQLFSAASSVTAAASPLLLFYGLSQAGRAVAAAATGKENAHRWQLNGHGITNSSAAGLRPAQLATLTLRNQGDGAFTQLADILRAASLPTPVALGDIWCLLPESTHFPLLGMGDARPKHLQCTSYGVRDDQKLLASIHVPTKMLERTPSADPLDAIAGWDEPRAAVKEHLAGFPSLRGFDFTTPEGQRIEVRGHGSTTTEIVIQREKSPNRSDQDEILRYAVGYRSATLTFPKIGSDERPPHPLLLW